MERIGLVVSFFFFFERGKGAVGLFLLTCGGIDREFVEFAKRRQVDDIVSGY